MGILGISDFSEVEGRVDVWAAMTLTSRSVGVPFPGLRSPSPVPVSSPHVARAAGSLRGTPEVTVQQDPRAPRSTALKVDPIARAFAPPEMCDVAFLRQTAPTPGNVVRCYDVL